jgi:hypothetical protein
MRVPFCSSNKYNIPVVCLIFGLCLCGLFLMGMDQGKKKSISPDPVYTSPETGSGYYEVVIHDERPGVFLKAVTVSGGKTEINVLHENDDAHTVLKFADVKKITILKQSFRSKRHKENFVLVRVKYRNMANGKEVIEDDVLIPFNETIGGISKKSNSPKVWYFRDIDKKIEFIDLSKKREAPEDIIGRIFQQNQDQELAAQKKIKK